MESIDNTGVSSRSIILTLLREDLRSNKLILGLEALKVDADLYTLDVSDLVFELLGCTKEQADQLLDLYRELMDQAATIEDIEQCGGLDQMAEAACYKLLEAKQLLTNNSSSHV
jgi:hypothetical protein